jgi:nucleoside-diphosphate-sugar epimerase
MQRILVTGAAGQIGSELLPELRRRYGAENVVASDVRQQPDVIPAGPFAFVDVLRRDAIASAVERYRIDTIVHLAAILSAVGEERPLLAWEVNMQGLHNVLEVARDRGVEMVYCPSSIAVFGPSTPRVETPQETILRPSTMYGVTKVAGELLGAYYVRRFGLDVRGLRYPGIISSEAMPGGGTTDYAVQIFYDAIRDRRFTCFLRADTRLPMMYMPDCMRATIELLEADAATLKHRTGYNIAAMSFTPAELAEEIRKHVQDFAIEYRPDHRQAIADSWTESIDDTIAREEWGWRPRYDLATMTEDMIRRMREKHAAGLL